MVKICRQRKHSGRHSSHVTKASRVNAKRRVGRPRKLDPLWLPDDDELAKSAIFENAGVEPNITAKTARQYKEYVEEGRRERVSEKVRPAFDEGRKVANEIRRRIAKENLARAIAANGDLIKNEDLSISAVIKAMNELDQTFGAGHNTLRLAIIAARKRLLGQIAPEIPT